MQFLKIDKDMQLSDLQSIVGAQNLDSVLALNGLKRAPNIGEQFYAVTNTASQFPVADTEDGVIQRKLTLLNRYSGDADIFETVATLDESGWRVLSNTGTLPGMLKLPDYMKLPNTTDTVGNDIGVSKSVYNDTVKVISEGGQVDSSSLGFYDWYRAIPVSKGGGTISGPAFHWFNIPFGEVTLYSSLAGESMDFPCYPSDISDGYRANYDTMPDILYQYEPWQVYKGSGPRTSTISFDIHRDMWSGNHLDGKCAELLRFCEANCYAEYNGAAVNTAVVTLYIHGQAFISGIMTDVTPSWDGDSPIGLDGFYLHLKLSITITEVATERLNYSTVRGKGLIG